MTSLPLYYVAYNTGSAPSWNDQEGFDRKNEAIAFALPLCKRAKSCHDVVIRQGFPDESLELEIGISSAMSGRPLSDAELKRRTQDARIYRVVMMCPPKTPMDVIDWEDALKRGIEPIGMPDIRGRIKRFWAWEEAISKKWGPAFRAGKVSGEWLDKLADEAFKRIFGW